MGFAFRFYPSLHEAKSRLPRRAPELSGGQTGRIAGLRGSATRRGAELIPRVARGIGISLLATPGESEERRK